MSSPFEVADRLLRSRARYGDKHAARRLAARHLERLSLLAITVGDTPAQAALVAKQAFALALRSGGRFDDALLRAFALHAVALPVAEQALGRLLVLLVDLEEVPEERAAALLGLQPAQVHDLLRRARSGAGRVVAGRTCRGWGLASGRKGLSPAERAAGAAHLALCPRCRDRMVVLDRERRTLLTRAGGVAGLLAGGQLAALTLPSTSLAGGLVADKAAIAVIGAAGAAALATGTAVVTGVAPVSRLPVAPSTSVPAAPAVPAGAEPTATPVAVPAPRPSVNARPVPALPSASPLVAPTRVPLPPLDLPTELPLPLPTSVRLPVPGTSPLPLPTSLRLPPLLP